MTPEQALTFIEDHGIVLASAKGPVPNLAEVIAGQPITGSWWGHPAGKAIFAVFQIVENSPDVLTCRVVKGKISFVHRRLWPALARLSDRFPADHLAQIHQQHSQGGQHVNQIVPYPEWVPPEITEAAIGMDEGAARAALGNWI